MKRAVLYLHVDAAAGDDVIERALAIAANAQIRGDPGHPLS
jgi:hypothetical protein